MEIKKYKASAYFGNNFTGLDSDLNSDSWSEIEDFCHDMLMDGHYCEIKNNDSGKSLQITPDEYLDTFDGEFIYKASDLEECVNKDKKTINLKEAKNSAWDLASDINDFFEEFDPYGWDDAFGGETGADVNEAIAETAREIEDGNGEEVIEQIMDFMEMNGYPDDGDDKFFAAGDALIKRIKAFNAVTESFREDKEIKRYSDVYDDERRQRGWWYFTTHGVMPGSIPKGVNVLEVRDGKNNRGTMGTFVRLDAILNTSELNDFDLKEMSPMDECVDGCAQKNLKKNDLEEDLNPSTIHDYIDVFVPTESLGEMAYEWMTAEDLTDMLESNGYDDVTGEYSINEDVNKEWKPNLNFKHIKDVLETALARGKYVNNERDEVMAALDLCDKKQKYTPEQRKYIRDSHQEMWKKGKKTESASIKKNRSKRLLKESKWAYGVKPRKLDMDLYDIVTVDTNERASSKRFESEEDCLNFIKKNAKNNNWLAVRTSELKSKKDRLTDYGKSIAKASGVDESLKEDAMDSFKFSSDEVKRKAQTLYDNGLITKNQLIWSFGEKDIIDLYDKHFDKNGKQRRKSKYGKLKEAKQWSTKYPQYRFTFSDGIEITAADEDEAKAKYQDIQDNRYNGVRSKDELDEIARKYYVDNNDWAFHYFSDDELAILWSMCMISKENPFGRNYDDEVYEAIYDFPTGAKIMRKAEKLFLQKGELNTSIKESVEDDEDAEYEALKAVVKPMTDDFHEAEADLSDFYMTWNFGYNNDGFVTGGIDIRMNDRNDLDKAEEAKKKVEAIFAKNGFELDKTFPKNPGKTLFGGIHYQIISKDKILSESLKEGAEGRKEPGFEFVILDMTDEKNPTVVAKRTTKVEAEWAALKMSGRAYGHKGMKKFDGKELEVQKAPIGEYKVGDKISLDDYPYYNESLKEGRNLGRHFEPAFGNPEKYIKKCLSGEVKSPYFKRLSDDKVSLAGSLYSVKETEGGYEVKALDESLKESIKNSKVIDFLKSIEFGDDFDFKEIGDWGISAWSTPPRHNFSTGFYIVQLDSDKLNKHFVIPDSQSKEEFRYKRDSFIKRHLNDLSESLKKKKLGEELLRTVDFGEIRIVDKSSITRYDTFIKNDAVDEFSYYQTPSGEIVAVENFDESLKESFFEKDLSGVNLIDRFDFVNKKRNGVQGIYSIRDFVNALNSVGLDEFKVRSNRFGNNLSEADLKDSWMDIRRNGWSVSRCIDNSLSGFNEVYLCKKINVNESLKLNEFFDPTNYGVVKYNVYDSNDNYIAQNVSKEKSAIKICKENGGKEVEAVCWYDRADYNKHKPADYFTVVYRNSNGVNESFKEGASDGDFLVKYEAVIYDDNLENFDVLEVIEGRTVTKEQVIKKFPFTQRGFDWMTKEDWEEWGSDEHHDESLSSYIFRASGLNNDPVCKKRFREIVEENPEEDNLFARYEVETLNPDVFKSRVKKMSTFLGKKLLSRNESLNEARPLAKSIMKRYNKAYKSFDSKRDWVKGENDKIAKKWDEVSNGAPMHDAIKDLLKKEPKFSTYEPELSSGLEREEYPYYVTMYEETPYYHPEEGGYYVAGRTAISSDGFESRAEAIQYAKELADDYDLQRLSDTHYSTNSKYIGDDTHICVETSREYLKFEKGDEMYESLTEGKMWVEKKYPKQMSALKRFMKSLGYGLEDYQFGVFEPPYGLKLDVYPLDRIDMSKEDEIITAANKSFSSFDGFEIRGITPMRIELVFRNDELTEDTIKTKDGKWTNKGKEGTHGKFKTKKEADAQRKAMFAGGYHESLDEGIKDVLNIVTVKDVKNCLKYIPKELYKVSKGRDGIVVTTYPGIRNYWHELDDFFDKFDVSELSDSSYGDNCDNIFVIRGYKNMRATATGRFAPARA